MFGFNPIQSIIGGVAAIAVSLLVGGWYGNAYGPNARKLASAQAQLEAINKALKTLQAEDAELAAREDAEEQARMEAFHKADVQKLPVNKSTAEALNKLADGG